MLPALFIGQAQQAHAQKKAKANQSQMAEEYFLEGCKYDILGSQDKAIYYFEKAQEADPNNAAIYFKLAETKAKLGKPAEATPFINKAMSLAPANKHYVMLAGELLIRQGSYADAIKVYQKGLKQFPFERPFQELVAEAYIAQSKFEDALRTLDRIQKTFGNSEELIRRKQQLLLKLNRLGDAIKESQSLVNQYPDEPVYTLMLAQLLVSNDKIDQARQYLQRHETNLQSHPEYHLLMYDLETKSGNTQKAQLSLQKAFADPALSLDSKIQYLGSYFNKNVSAQDSILVLTLVNALITSHPMDARGYCLKGDFLAAKGHVADARQLYIQSLQYDRSRFAVWEQIVRLDLELSQTDSLQKHTDQALELFPTNGTFWFYNGLANSINKKNNNAVSSLERARKFGSANPRMVVDANSWLGDLYHELKEYDKSDEAYSAVLASDSLNIHVLNNWSYFLSLRGQRLTLASRLGRKLINIQPDDPSYQDTYGWVLFKAGNYQDALYHLEKAAKARPESGTILEHYGDVLSKTGKNAQAVEVWKKAKTAGGDLSPRLDEKIQTGSYAD